jgi:hypothetical protein
MLLLLLLLLQLRLPQTPVTPQQHSARMWMAGVRRCRRVCGEGGGGRANALCQNRLLLISDLNRTVQRHLHVSRSRHCC